jgi:hypothetical protein
MAFLLRLKSQSASGREIVREVRAESDRLTLGRDPECDVHLTDLAVALHHGTIEKGGGHQLNVIAEPGLWIDLNGRKVKAGRIDLASGGTIRIASHLLRFMPVAAGESDIPIDVERISESDTKVSKGEERMFSLQSRMPSKRAVAWLLSLLVLGVFLAWPIKDFYNRQNQQLAAREYHPDSSWSSGPLSAAHAQLENNCQACHVKPFEAVRDQSCKACHTNVHDHADPFRLARAEPDLDRWGKVMLAFKETFNLPPGRCVDCHTEHEGKRAMPTTAQRFCSDCHQSLHSKLPDTKLANAGDFGTLHPEFRPALITQWVQDKPVVQRLALSSNPMEQTNLKFPHALHLSKTNGVAQMARRLSAEHGFGQSLDCADCHDPDPSGARFQPVSMAEDCAMCHSLDFERQGSLVRTLRHGDPAQVVADLKDFYRIRPPRLPPNLQPGARRLPGDSMESHELAQFRRAVANPARAEQAIRAVFSRGGACYDCHEVQAPRRGSLAYKIRPVAFPVRYMLHGWFDHKAHQTETCESCHKAGSSNSARDLLLPDLASCRACHGGESARGKLVQSSCAMCHDYHFDTGKPAMLIRRRVGGKKRDSIVADAEPRRDASAVAAGGAR